MSRRFPVAQHDLTPLRRRSAARALAVVVLVLQGLLWGGGSILEARSAAESLTRTAHVEDTGASKCPPIHRHLDCLVCRTFSGGATSGHASPLVGIASSSQLDPDAEPASRSSQASCGPVGSRAPPRA